MKAKTVIMIPNLFGRTSGRMLLQSNGDFMVTQIPVSACGLLVDGIFESIVGIPCGAL